MKRTNEEIDRLRETVISLSSDHDDAADDYIDWVKDTIQSIHQQLDEFQKIQYEFSPLNIPNSIITLPSPICDFKRHLTPLKDLFSSAFDFQYPTLENNPSFSLKSPKQKLIIPSDHWHSLAKNETHLLITGKSDLFLIDHLFKLQNKKSFLQIGIKDICWSKILSRFILISPKEIFILDEITMSLDSCSINLINNNPWERGTCSDTSLFISTFGENPLIVEYYLFPSIHLNKKYQSTIVCGESEVISDMKSNNNSLGFIIDNGFKNQSRLELRSIKSLESIWSIHLGKGWNYRCSLLNNSEWIVTDSYNHRIIHILNNGTIDRTESYSAKPLNVIRWSEDQIAIRTTEGVNVHQYK
jgi:hypothetical protein